jgi:hypothetical protein
MSWPKLDPMDHLLVEGDIFASFRHVDIISRLGRLRPMLTVAQKSKTKMAATFDFEFF